jgi:hypothetical protein
VAAGSDRYGYWFDLQEHPTGPSADDSVCPPGEPLGEFVNNTAHSNVRYGLRVFNHWVPMADGLACRWKSSYWSLEAAQTVVLDRFTSYKNGRSGAPSSTAAPARIGVRERGMVDV